MKIIKYPLASLIFFSFFAGYPQFSYSWEMGGKIGGAFQSFYLDAKNEAKEDSSFGFQTSLFFEFLPHERIILLTELGFSDYVTAFYTPWIGFTAAFVIYPEYIPFIGLSIREHYYNKVFPGKKNKWLTGVYLSLGSKVFIQGPHSVWMFFDYLVFQSLYQKYSSSNFSLSFAYSYRFDLPKIS